MQGGDKSLNLQCLCVCVCVCGFICVLMWVVCVWCGMWLKKKKVPCSRKDHMVQKCGHMRHMSSWRERQTPPPFSLHHSSLHDCLYHTHSRPEDTHTYTHAHPGTCPATSVFHMTYRPKYGRSHFSDAKVQDWGKTEPFSTVWDGYYSCGAWTTPLRTSSLIER